MTTLDQTTELPASDRNGTATAEAEPRMARDGNNARASFQFSLDHITQNTAHCRPAASKALRDLFIYALRDDMTLAEAARAVDMHPTTLSRHLRGKYVDPHTKERLDLSDDQLKKVQAWLTQRRAQADLREDFVRTPTAAKVWKAADLARESKTIVMLYGPSHVGKTWALEQYAALNNHGDSPYVRLKSGGGLRSMLQVIGDAVGISPKGSTDALKDRIIRALHRDQVLLFDEVHLLLWTYQQQSFMACVEYLRELHDHVHCGLVLSMTNFGRDELVIKRRAELEQTLRRGVHRVQLPKQPQKKDLELILRASGLDFPEKGLRVQIADAAGKQVGEQPYKLLRQLGRDEGLLSITERLRYAKKLAARRRADAPTWEDFVAAHLTIARATVEENDWDEA
ncbi:MAG: AAA family ATPase [Opitutales bacterium]